MKTPSNQKGFAPILLLLGILIIGGSVVAGTLYLSKTYNNTSKTTIMPTDIPRTITPTDTITPTVTVILNKNVTNIPEGNTKQYIKRQIDVTKSFFGSHAYPKELTVLKDSDVMGMWCSEKYSGYGKDFRQLIEATGEEGKPLTDSTLLSFVEIAQKNYPSKEIRSISYCQTENNQMIYLYSVGPCGGGCYGDPYVGVVENSSLKELGTANIALPYVTCHKPILMTKTGAFYYQCGGGDGGYGGKVIYKIDMKSGQQTKAIECTSNIGTIDCK